MQVLGANPAAPVSGLDQLPGQVNYFIGNDPSHWHTHVPTYAKVEYQQVYPGIDLVYYGNQQQLEYDFVVAPGADPSPIGLGFTGADRVEVDGQGDLVVHGGSQEVRQHKPVVYQEMSGRRREVASGFVLRGPGQVGFQLAAYDPGQPLVIDPMLTYSTYLGGSYFDQGNGIAVDPTTGDALVTGFTGSTNFPTSPGTFQTSNHTMNGGNAFVTKLNAAGTALVYSTYLGGSNYDAGYAIAVDPSTGDALVTGETHSTNFPTANALWPSKPSPESSVSAFVTRIRANGSALVYSTYFGGSTGETGQGIAVDPATGDALVTGYTDSRDLPIANGFQSNLGGDRDAFVTRFLADGSDLVYSTYLGGSGVDRAYGIAVDPATGDALVTGLTGSTDFPTANALQPRLGGPSGSAENAFVTRIRANGSVVYSTYLGGSNLDSGNGIAVDPSTGDALVTGFTSSTDFPTANALQPRRAGSANAFVTRIRADGSAPLIYSTYLGGSTSDYGNGIAVDPSTGAVLVTGVTSSTDFPTRTPSQPNRAGSANAFVTAVRGDGSALVYSTYLGGSNLDAASAVAVDNSGNAYVTGSTKSTDFPTTPSAFQTTLRGISNAFVTKIDKCLPPATGQWVPRGPAPILNGQTPGNQPVSGRITALAPDPRDANVLYAAAAGGGVWKTADGGTHWLPLTDDQPSLVMGAVALAPSNPDIIYAGTGEANNSGDSFYGYGLLKSDNAGASWRDLGTEFQRAAVSGIVIDPIDPQTVYLAVGPRQVNGKSSGTGIWKTTDGGTSWADTTVPTIPDTVGFSDLVMDPLDHMVLYAAVGQPHGDAANGVYKTTDAGGHWQRAGDFPPGGQDGRITLTVAGLTPQVVYAAVTDKDTQGLLHIYKTTDAGTTWAALPDPPNYLGNRGNYDTTLAATAFGLTVFAGGAGSDDTTGSQIVMSTDGGTTWRDVSGVDGPTGPHADHHAAAFDKNGKLLVGTDGGVWRLDDAQPAQPVWSDLNGDLQVTQFVSVALHPTNPNVAYGGSQDNGTEKYTGTLPWTHVADGDGGMVAVDAKSPQTVYHEFYYAPGDASFFQRSDDGGFTWADKTSGIMPTDQGTFYVPYAIDARNPARLVLGTDHVYETTTKADAWNVIATPGAGGFNTNGAVVDAVALAESDPKTIYVTAGGQVFVTTDDGVSWDSNLSLDHFSDVAVDPTNPRIAYAVRDRFDDVYTGRVYRTSNGGLTWNDISGNLPPFPLNTIAVDPTVVPAVLYVGTDTGVYVSRDTGTTWSRFGTGLPNVRVSQIVLNSCNVPTVATYGRGMWQLVPPPPHAGDGRGNATAGASARPAASAPVGVLALADLLEAPAALPSALVEFGAHRVAGTHLVSEAPRVDRLGSAAAGPGLGCWPVRAAPMAEIDAAWEDLALWSPDSLPPTWGT
jgi:photosystem II stability/assembly factor-like uncharacterized protein